MSDAASTVNPSGSAPARGRRRAAAQIAAAQIEPSADTDNSEPVKKKKKPNRTVLGKIRGRNGALKAFASLPLDLVFAICSYLDPTDLYVLSNTNKAFHAVVSGSSSAQLWIDARASVGLPELELPMTDLQYAALLFGRGCQFCERKNAGKPEVYFRARICVACLKSEFVCPYIAKGLLEIEDALPQAHVGTIRLATTTHSHYRERRLARLPQILKLDEGLQDAFPETDHTDAQFLTSLLQPELSGSVPGEPANPFQEWVMEKWKPARDARFADGHALTKWLAAQDRAKMTSKSEIRNQRRAVLEARFTAQGFGPAEFNSEWRGDPLVKKPQLLTDRTWARAEPILREKLSRIRKKARTESMSDLFKSISRDRPLLPKMGFSFHVAPTLPIIARLVADNSSTASGTELFRDNADAILDAAVAVVRDRMKEMIRFIAAAHAEIRRGREEGIEFSDAMEGLDYKSVDLPLLPSWIPRNPETPFDADSEQMFAFLRSHALSTFRCRKCDGVFSGTTAAHHAAGPWRDCAPSHQHNSIDVAEWLSIGGTCLHGLDSDARTLLRTLKLKELANSLELKCSNKAYEVSAERHGIKMRKEKKFVVEYDCKCECGTNWGLSLHETHSLLSKHWETKPGHTVTVTPDVNYSRAFRDKVDAAKRGNTFDYFGFRGYDDSSDASD